MINQKKENRRYKKEERKKREQQENVNYKFIQQQQLTKQLTNN
tara:strand:+ start:1609 stop:1737 length:129 start_codon:yes stop_codon:yes gene_type:complete